MTYILFILGFAVLIYGAEWLIEGASKLASRVGVSDFIVGLTVVAFGTSLPELVVNLFAGEESSQLAIGNVVGSNIANILLILGITAVITPLSVRRTTVYREIVFNVAAAVMLGVLVSERFLSEGGFTGLDHIDGAVLISYFVIFLYYTFGRSSTRQVADDALTDTEGLNMATTIFKVLVGSVGLWLGGQWIVNGAIQIGSTLGISDGLIGLTIVALGTSLPELAASIAAVRKKNVDIAVGNIVGSNLFNIFWVLGLSAFINPLAFEESLVYDIFINIGVAVILFVAMVVGRYKHQISATEGRIFITLYVLYIVSTIIRG